LRQNLSAFVSNDGTRHGISALAILPLEWSAEGWPAVPLQIKETQ